VVPPKTLEIGEIKPADSDENAIEDIDFYLDLVSRDPTWQGYNVRPLELPCPQPLDFPTLSLDCPRQDLHVANVKGLYLYFCTPSFAELMAQGCKCRTRRRDKDKHDYPVIGDKVKDKRPKTKDKFEDKGDDRPPLHLLDKETAEIVAGVAAAIAALGMALGAIPSPLTILEALGAALGAALARLLTALGFGIAAEALMLLLEESAGADPDRTKGTYPVPGGPNPKLPPKGVPPAGTGTRPTPSGTAKQPAPQKSQAHPTGGHGKAEPGGHLTQWANIEHLNVATAWVGQELWVVGRGSDGYSRGWFLVVTNKVSKDGKTTLTMRSFEEYAEGHAVAPGNTYVVTQPYRSADPEHDPESVLLALGERPNLPKEARQARGIALIVSLMLAYADTVRERRKAGL
jgi:hypothetical protein